MLYHVENPGAALRDFARVLRPGGRLAVATNGAGHLAELDALGPAIGRPALQIGANLGNFNAERGAPLVGRHFGDVVVERYPSGLEIPVTEPILAYLDSLADTALTPAERAAAVEAIESRIAAEGTFRVTKHTVLITATRR
jgi:SAM-dependent methyltransferase